MQRSIYFVLCAIIVSISSCNGEGPDGTDLGIDTVVVIDTGLGIDTTNINPIDTVAVDSAGYIDEDNALSTAEAGYHVLSQLDNESTASETADKFGSILTAFDNMIEFHISQMPEGVYQKNYRSE